VKKINSSPSYLAQTGAAVGYHGGMTRMTRDNVLDKILGSDIAAGSGHVKVFWLVCTTWSVAEGLDRHTLDCKCDLFGPPVNVETKRQSDGRIGRQHSAMPALAVTFWCPSSLSGMRYFLQYQPQASVSSLLQVADILTSGRCRRRADLEANGSVLPETELDICCDICSRELREGCAVSSARVMARPHELATSLAEVLELLEGEMARSTRPRDAVPYRQAFALARSVFYRNHRGQLSSTYVSALWTRLLLAGDIALHPWTDSAGSNSDPDSAAAWSGDAPRLGVYIVPTVRLARLARDQAAAF
jgi:hypothetical protein